MPLQHLTDGPDHLFGPFSLALTYNTGIAFSLLSGWTLPIVIGAVVLVGLVAYLGYGVRTIPAAAGVGLVLGGATGNLCDRLIRGRGGAVVDFIHTGFWPTFNVADSSITIGCIVLALGHPGRGTPVASSPPSNRRPTAAVIVVSEHFEVPLALDGERLDRALALLTGRSRGELAAVIATGDVRIGDAVITVRHRRVEAGEAVAIDLPPPVAPRLAPTRQPRGRVQVCYEDDEIVVINKPAGLVVHPGAGHVDDTLVSGCWRAIPI